MSSLDWASSSMVDQAPRGPSGQGKPETRPAPVYGCTCRPVTTTRDSRDPDYGVKIRHKKREPLSSLSRRQTNL
jgi:hypothetical protein